MPPIRCHYADCVFLDEGFCGATAIELDIDDGCLTYERGEVETVDTVWDDDEVLDDLWEEEDEILYEGAAEEDWYENELGDLEE
ncbi:MAG: hypothetical protein WBR18_07380 [Anaerolineales bacterium]